MKNIKLLKPQPSPKNGRDALTNVTNYFGARPKSNKDTNRSPDCSPTHSNRTRFATQASNNSRQEIKLNHSKLQIETKYSPISLKCINHKDKNGKFKVQNDSSCYIYCQNCAIELNQKGKRLVSLKAEDKNSKMITQSKKYLQQCEQVLAILTYKIGELRVQRFKIDSKYRKIMEDIEQQKQRTILKITMQYECQVREQEEHRKRFSLKIQEEENRLKQFQKEFQIAKHDIVENIKEINIFINLGDFREVMDYYWKNIQEFNEMVSNKYPQINSHRQTHEAQGFPKSNYNQYNKEHNANNKRLVNKGSKDDYDSSSLRQQQSLYQTNVHLKGIPSGKQFTFSKNLLNFDNRGKEAYSIELSNQVTNSSQSVVEERLFIR